MFPLMSVRQVMVNTAAVIFVVFLAWFIVQIRSTLLLLVLGILFGAAIEPLVNRLRRRGLSRGQSILVVYLSLIGLLALFLFLIVPPLVSQATSLYDDIPNILSDLRAQAAGSHNQFIRTNGVRIVDRARDAYDSVKRDPPVGQDQAVQAAFTIGGFLFTVVTVLIVAFYWMTEKAIIKRLLLGLIPIERRDRGHALWDEIESRIGGWTRGQLTLCAVIGLLSTIAYFLLGLNFWLALGIWAGFTEIIPFVGPFLGGAAAVTIALTDSWQKAVLVIIFVLALQQLEGAFLVPRVMRNAVGMTPLTVIMAVLIGGSLAGPLGSVLAIPVGAAVQALVQELLRQRADDPDTRARVHAAVATPTSEEPILSSRETLTGDRA